MKNAVPRVAAYREGCRVQGLTPLSDEAVIQVLRELEREGFLRFDTATGGGIELVQRPLSAP